MTDLTARLDAIQARAANCRTYNFGMRAADKLAHEDAWFLLELAREQQAAIDAVTDIVNEWESYDNPAIETYIIREALEAKP